MSDDINLFDVISALASGDGLISCHSRRHWLSLLQISTPVLRLLPASAGWTPVRCRRRRRHYSAASVVALCRDTRKVYDVTLDCFTVPLHTAL